MRAVAFAVSQMNLEFFHVCRLLNIPKHSVDSGKHYKKVIMYTAVIL